MEITITLKYPSGAEAVIRIPLAENTPSAVTHAEEGQKAQEDATPAQCGYAVFPSKTFNELESIVSIVREKEGNDGIGRIGGVGERKEREAGEEKPEPFYCTSFDAQGGTYVPPASLIADFLAAYGPDLLKREFPIAKAWLASNPSKRKTLRGMGRFLNAWLCRAQRVVPAPVKQAVLKTGSLLDSITNSQEGW